ncbi:GNAT family N-acetyltransferase [Dactylosporangium maewongense]|uniref:GNAT family N-acetyltransferase n=1 Tax=Dactylosporangium maewongense TaxID=634393 RepID=A0ABP4LLU3_9ACTN
MTAVREGLTVGLHDPVTDPEPADWEALRARAGLRANWAWPVMRAGVLSGADPVLLAVLSDVEGPVGLVAASVVAPRRSAAGASAPGFPRVGYLHVQAPQSSAVPGFWFASPAVQERASLVRAFRRAARRTLGPGVRGALWRQLGEGDDAWLPWPRYTRDTEPLAVLDAPESVDAWLAGLGQKRRASVRRTQRLVAADPDLQVRTGRVGEVVTPAELAHLTRLNFAKHAAGSVELRSGPRSEVWQASVAGRADVCIVAYRDAAGRLLGAATILDDPVWPVWLSWGALPVEDGGRRHLYFDLFRRLVERVVDRGARGMILGKGMSELKSDLGAHLVPQHGAVTA